MLMDTLQPCLEALQDGKPVRSVEFSPEQRAILRTQQLITSKPLLYVCNVGEDEVIGGGNAHSAAMDTLAAAEGAATIRISAAIEEEIAQMDADDQAIFWLIWA